jgi:hypothetical protein
VRALVACVAKLGEIDAGVKMSARVRSPGRAAEVGKAVPYGIYDLAANEGFRGRRRRW